MSNYFNVEHKFNVGEIVKAKGSVFSHFIILSVLAERLTTESYGYVDVSYQLRLNDGRVIMMKEIELESFQEENKHEVTQQTTTPFDSF